MDKPKLPRAPRKGDILLAQLRSGSGLKPERQTDERADSFSSIGDIAASMFPGAASTLRQSPGDTPPPDLYETLSTLEAKVTDLMNMMGLSHTVLGAQNDNIAAVHVSILKLEKRVKSLEKKAAKHRNEHERVKVLEGHLRAGDRYGDKNVIWLGKTWKDKFWANEGDMPLGIVFASGEEYRWVSVQYAYLSDDDDD